MARHVLITLLALLVVALSGCLRVEFDRCDDDEPHPDCALLDGASDAGADASAPDASADAGT